MTLGSKLNFRYHQREAKKIEDKPKNNFIELFDDRIETGPNFLLIVLIYTMQYVWHYPFHSALLLENSSKIVFSFTKLLTNTEIPGSKALVRDPTAAILP